MVISTSHVNEGKNIIVMIDKKNKLKKKKRNKENSEGGDHEGILHDNVGEDNVNQQNGMHLQALTNLIRSCFFFPH